MTLHRQLSALDWGELKGTKIWRKLWFLMEEPTALATQMAFRQMGSPLIPVYKENHFTKKNETNHPWSMLEKKRQ